MRSILPLFPLGTVLFPEGMLPLRVFEARYMDMVRKSMREASEFGVCLIRHGEEVGGRDVETESIGCRARIASWNMEQLGVLQLEMTGTERFRIHSHLVQADGLMVADVESIEPDPPLAVTDDAASCVRLLERIIEQLSDAKEGAGLPVATPHRFDDLTWVGNRLAEWLPLPLATKQQLMSLTDSAERIAIVKRYLVGQGIA